MHHEGKSALHIAVMERNVENTKQLLDDKRIDVALICGYYTAFHLAATDIRPEADPDQILIMKMLLAHKDHDVNLISNSTNNGYSALHEVMQTISTRIGNEAHNNQVFNLLLLAKDIKVNTSTDKTFGHTTPLHQTAKMGRLDFVEALLAHEDIEIKKDLKGNLPQDGAGKYPLVIDAFKRYLQNPDDFKNQYKIKQSHNEIRKNAKVLTQGSRTGGFFESIDINVLNKIAAFTRDQCVHSEEEEEEALEISGMFMDKKI